MNRLNTFFAGLVLVALQPAFAAEPRTEHTFQLEEGEERPAATIDDASWLVGSWVGTGFGQKFEEVWTRPSVGTMVGLFKLYTDEGVSFYEILLLEVEDGALSLKVKHFSDEFVSWEDKEDYVNFKLVAKEEDALHFGGISFYRRSDDRIDGYIVMRNGDEVTEHHLVHERQAP